jgi:hypothetical protein
MRLPLELRCTLACEQHDGSRQLLVEFADLGKKLLARHHPCFGSLLGLPKS